MLHTHFENCVLENSRLFRKKTYPPYHANYKKSLSVVKCYVLTQCSMTINSGSAANSSSVLQELCRSMQDSKVNVDVENGPPLGPILSRMNGSSSSSQFEIRLNIIPQQLCLQVLSTKNLHALLSCPVHLFLFHLTTANNILRRLQIINLLIKQSTSASTYLLPPRSKYFPHLHILECPHSTFLRECEGPSFKPISNTDFSFTVLCISHEDRRF